MLSNNSVIQELFPSAEINRIEEYSIIKSFNCNDSDFNSFLFEESKNHAKYLLNVTYVLEIEDKTIAYYTLANDVLRVNMTANRKFKSTLRKSVKDSFKYQLFKQETFPAVKIGILAVDNEFQSKGIGSELLDLIIYSFINGNKTGCMFITVDAVKTACAFYEQNHFFYLSKNDEGADSRQMYRCLL